MRPFALFLLLLFCGLASAQTTRSEGGAEWLDRQIREDLARTLKTPAGRDPLAEHPFHFVFLVDASQASWKSAYAEFARSTIERFLENVARRQKGREGENSLVSIYPYQLEPYRSDELSATALPLTPSSIATIVSKVPKSTIPVRADGKTAMPKQGGHDHVGSRRTVLDQVVTKDPKRPAILIQFSPIEVNEVPNDTALDRQRRPISARSGLLEGTGYRAVATSGLPLKTDAPGGGQQPYDVYVWITVPEDMSGIASLAPAAPPPARDPGLGWLPPLLGLLVLAAAAFAAYRFFTKPVLVTLTSGTNSIFSRKIRPGQRFEIWGPQSTPPAVNAAALPNNVAPGMPAQRLARIVATTSGAKVEPDLCDVYAPGHTGGELRVEKNRKSGFQLTRGNQKTLMMQLHVQ
ncbi:MAG TPA: hypothetical protein VGE01_02110 [Fimbriimonas sp.]